MKKTGAWLTVYALEQIGVTRTFGIPGVHNTEIYDELHKSLKIEPVLVTHEGAGAFMADAISRTGTSIGCLVIVPAAGMTHALSGIGEAFLGGIPLIVISGGIRTDSGRSYQLHDIDQHKILAGITKKSWKVGHHRDIIPTIFDAYNTAISDEPGPVFVEIPVNLQLFQEEIGDLPRFEIKKSVPEPDESAVREAAKLLMQAKHPGIFMGWGAAGSTEACVQLAEMIGAPVATSLQGLSVFPGNHPLHTGMGIGNYSVPASEIAFASCDCLLAVGVRFGEIATGSFGMAVPENLIHIDINPAVFNKNYPAKVTITGDSDAVIRRLNAELNIPEQGPARKAKLQAVIHKAKTSYKKDWAKKVNTGKVNPAIFFEILRELLPDDTIITTDDGNHTFLTAELFEVRKSRTFISPTDFNCMGYCVPATIGAKMANPDKIAIGICGDGAFLMTGMELLTAKKMGLGVIIFIFNDGELSQISQGQEIPYNRKVCTKLGNADFEGMAIATGSGYVHMEDNGTIKADIQEAIEGAREGNPVIVDVNIDYSRRTRFTQGVVQTNLARFPLKEKARFIGRAIKRKITG